MRISTTLAGLASLLALNAIGAEADAEYRKHAMQAVGGHMQAIVKIIRGEVPHASHLPMHGNAMADLAEAAGSLFPEGSEGGDALPAIWEDPEDFAEKIEAFRAAAQGFKEAAAGGDVGAAGAALQNLGGACKGCHDDYRQE